MFRLASAVLMFTLWSVSLFQNNLPTTATAGVPEGAYEFVLETTVLTKPKELTEYRSSSDWVGLWLFKDGYFSQTMMKRQRAFWLPHFPKKPEDLGYGSTAGTYKLAGRNLELTLSLRLSPNYVGQPWLMEYQLEGETLTLTETWHPNPHNDSEGRRTIVLRRTKG